MKIAVISDIHGNMQALETVLNDIEDEKVDKIYCLGDLAMAGPEPVKAIEKIIELKNSNKLDLIQGNTDLMIADNEFYLPIVKEKFPLMGNALEADIKEIDENLKMFLKNLPKNLELEIEGKKVLMVHGSPRKNDENIFPDMPLKQVENIIDSTDADLILCGHTHIPCGYQTSTKQTIVNVGSVGRPFVENPQACYAIIDIKNGSINTEHKLLDYDKELAANIVSKRNFEGADLLAKMLIKPENRHV